MQSKEINIKLLKLEAEAREKAALLCDKIIEIVPKFDGKDATKRFDTALKAIDKGLSFETRFNSFVINYFIEKRIVTEKGTSHYLTGSSVTIIHASIQSSYGDGICQNGKIDGRQLIAHIEKGKEYLQKNVSDIRRDISNIDLILKRFNDIQDEKEIFNSSICWATRDYFKLKV